MSAVNRPAAESAPDSTVLSLPAQAAGAEPRARTRSSPLLLGLLPISTLLMGLFLVPLSIMVLYSFWLVVGVNVVRSVTLDNYSQFFILPASLRVLTRAFATSAAVTVIALIVGYPFAYFLVRYTSPRWQRLFLVLVILIMMGMMI